MGMDPPSAGLFGMCSRPLDGRSVPCVPLPFSMMLVQAKERRSYDCSMTRKIVSSSSIPSKVAADTPASQKI